jgi:hypothetical protein
MRIFVFIKTMLVLSLHADGIGSVTELNGIHAEINRTGEQLPVSVNVGVNSYDDVRTANTRLGITFSDDSIVRLTEHSKLILDEVVFDPNPSKSKIGLQFASGTARFITGKIGAINKENISISTPTAQIGIRGTDFTVTVDELGRSLVILLPDLNGISSGEITVATAAGTTVLNKPFESTVASMWEKAPSSNVILDLTLDAIDNMLIVSPPKEEELVEEEKTARADFLDFNDLEVDLLAEDFFEEDLEFSEIDVDLLDVNFLEDLLDIIEAVDELKEGGKELDSDGSLQITGTEIGQDAETQIITLVDSGRLKMTRSISDTIYVNLDASQGYNIILSQDGKDINIVVNSGGSSIILRQSE